MGKRRDCKERVMADKEYIEREAAIAAAFSATSLGNSAFRDVYDTVSRLRLIPAADVRPVVTCADCKHNNACLTQAFVEEASRVPFDRSTFFCADGKR